MKLSVDRKALADAARAASKFLPTIHHIAALQHLEIEAHSNQLMVSATNLEAGRTVEVEADIETDGRILAPVNFAQIAAGAQGSTLELSATESNLSISDGASKWRLQLGNVDDYPETSPDVDEETDVESWQRIRAVATAAGKKSDRPILQGVHFGDGYAVATDSYRIAWTEFDAPEALVPSAAIRSLDVPVETLGFGTRHVTAKVEDGFWWSRVIDGSFPNWQDLVKRHDVNTTVVVSAEALDDAVKRSLFVAESHIPVILTVGDGIEVSRKVQGDVAYTEIVEADVDGEDMRIAFNPSYLRDMIEPVEKVTITLDDPAKFARIDGGWWKAGLMPVRGGAD